MRRLILAVLAAPALFAPALYALKPDTRPPIGTTLHITGRVTDAATGRPLAGAQVAVVGGPAGALTRADGSYRLDAPLPRSGRLELAAQMIGYARQPRSVRPRGDSVRVDFALAPAAVALDEAVVTGVTKTAAAPRAILAQRRAAVGRTAMAAASAAPPGLADRAAAPRAGGRRDTAFNTEAYARIDENPFLAVTANPLSTFSIDVDRASYSNLRRFVAEGQRPPADAVRIEEMVNYFTFDAPEPPAGRPLAVVTEVAPAPWAPAHRLVRLLLRAPSVAADRLPPSNLVFLVDVSGSMDEPDKLPLVKSSLELLVNELRPEDRVALVVYAGAAGLVLPPTPGDRKEVIREAISRLEAGGSTAGGAGLELAYRVARENFRAGGNNRVILATDGDFNVGPSSDAEMVRLIEEKRKEGTFLTVLGFGTGNLKDSKMEQLADHGNGNYAYIDDLLEARKVLVHEMGGTLHTVAKDVKIQVEFNPARVRAYRLIGYENRLLASEDFNDDAKDAGELGAGHAVTALYELIPAGAASDTPVRVPDSLRYQRTRVAADAASHPELLFLKVRYKDPDGARSKLLEQPVLDGGRAPSGDFRFAAAVAELGMLLRGSEHRGAASLDQVLALARAGLGEDPGEYRRGFVRLAERIGALGWLEGTVAATPEPPARLR
ncbi:MAG TPA: von Willebrand factor type A domain-containing protein [Longimicrobiales bacterium]|nr:von Willebrand factor type A domain-containing protein [Longimicrobiales bacterium]